MQIAAKPLVLTVRCSAHITPSPVQNNHPAVSPLEVSLRSPSPTDPRRPALRDAPVGARDALLASRADDGESRGGRRPRRRQQEAVRRGVCAGGQAGRRR